jgi:hypothetical protein
MMALTDITKSLTAEQSVACLERTKAKMIAEHNAAALSMKPADFEAWKAATFMPAMNKAMGALADARAVVGKATTYDTLIGVATTNVLSVSKTV